MRLIDADALYAHVKEEQRRNPHNGHVERMMHNHEHESFLRDIWYAPTIDAVPVVRCKDCIHYDMRSKESGYCYFWDHEQGMEPNRVVYDDFCAYGERKDGDGGA